MKNIIPPNDIKEHEPNITCLCCPTVEIENGKKIIIHNSFDGMELIEQQNYDE